MGGKPSNPKKGWTTSTVVDVDGKNIKVQNTGKSSFFTNASSPKKAGYLQTIKKFGDCTIEAEFLVPKDSNSGIYLMGRYEIQILDSHGKENVGYGDMGGLYRRWDNDRNPKGFDGVPPLVNAANPAGEWQKLIIKFRAPSPSQRRQSSRISSLHLCVSQRSTCSKKHYRKRPYSSRPTRWLGKQRSCLYSR